MSLVLFTKKIKSNAFASLNTLESICQSNIISTQTCYLFFNHFSGSSTRWYYFLSDFIVPVSVSFSVPVSFSVSASPLLLSLLNPLETQRFLEAVYMRNLLKCLLFISLKTSLHALSIKF